MTSKSEPRKNDPGPNIIRPQESVPNSVLDSDRYNLDLIRPIQSLTDVFGSGQQARGLPATIRVYQITALSGTQQLLGVSVLGAVPGGATPVLINPPRELVEAGRGAFIYSYTDVNNRQETTTPEAQFLIPPYAIGDVLLCALWPEDSALRDWNLAGRAWAAEAGAGGGG